MPNSRASLTAIRRLLAVGLGVALPCVLLCVPGCGSNAGAPTPATPALSGVKLKLVIVDDPALAAAISLLRGQWQAETGSELSIEEATSATIAANPTGAASADAIVYAPRLLGTLAEGGAIRPLTSASLAAPELDWQDVFELLKTREVIWGRDTYAVPLGSPVLVCCFRADLLMELGRQPPKTWDEYQRLAADLGQRKPANADWHGTVEPLAPGWAGLTLLARAAPYARHANHYSTLFNMQSMEPLVDSPPFVRALSELVAATKASAEKSLRTTPTDAWRAVADGQVALAIGWPARAVDADAVPGAESAPEIGCVELPGSTEVYNATSAHWERRGVGARSVPLIAMAGRVASLGAKSQDADAAMILLAWLASRKWSELATATSPDTAFFRDSQRSATAGWTRGLAGDVAAEYADAVAASLTRSDCLVAPRFPGAERYLAALDEAVRRAVAGEVDPQTALTAAAEQFRAITGELGLERQRIAYRHSLGLE